MSIYRRVGRSRKDLVGDGEGGFWRFKVVGQFLDFNVPSLTAVSAVTVVTAVTAAVPDCGMAVESQWNSDTP